MNTPLHHPTPRPPEDSPPPLEYVPEYELKVLKKTNPRLQKVPRIKTEPRSSIPGILLKEENALGIQCGCQILHRLSWPLLLQLGAKILALPLDEVRKRFPTKMELCEELRSRYPTQLRFSPGQVEAGQNLREFLEANTQFPDAIRERDQVTFRPQQLPQIMSEFPECRTAFEHVKSRAQRSLMELLDPVTHLPLNDFVDLGQEPSPLRYNWPSVKKADKAHVDQAFKEKLARQILLDWGDRYHTRQSMDFQFVFAPPLHLPSFEVQRINKYENIPDAWAIDIRPQLLARHLDPDQFRFFVPAEKPVRDQFLLRPEGNPSRWSWHDIYRYLGTRVILEAKSD